MTLAFKIVQLALHIVLLSLLAVPVLLIGVFGKHRIVGHCCGCSRFTDDAANVAEGRILCNACQEMIG